MDSTDHVTSEPSRFSIRLPRPLWIGLATVVLIVVAVGLRIGAPIYRQQVAIREIERLGGNVEAQNGGPDWLRRWVGHGWMKLFDKVVSVDLSVRQATDGTLSHVGCLTELQMLALTGTDVTDAGLAHLDGLNSVRMLSLNHTQVTNGGLAHLKGMTKLDQR